MQLLKEKKYNKVIKTFKLHPEIEAELHVTMENGKMTNATLEGKFSAGGKKPDCWPTIVKPEFLEFIKTQNPWAQVKGKFGWDGMAMEAKELAKLVLANPEFEIDPELFMWTYNSGHLIFDRFGDPVPVPYCFDYIGTPFTNERCDLKAMLAHLKQHPWIVNREELFIDDIPYYNNEDGWKQYIRGKELPWVQVLPDKESLKAIYKRGLEKDKEFFSVRMKDLILSDAVYNWPKTEEKDWLNIRQFYKPHEHSDY
jgi:hypothetical protein